MNKKTFENVKEPQTFQRKLRELVLQFYDFFEMAKEIDEYESDTKNESEKIQPYDHPCYYSCRQYKRPAEFLQALLDIIRINFEPEILGDFFLNSNMSFIYDEIPEKPFNLGYASLVSSPNEKFGSVWLMKVMPHLEVCNYRLGENATAFVAVTTGNERYNLDLVEEIYDFLGSAFTYEEAFELIAYELGDKNSKPRKNIYFGFSLAPELGTRMRISIWIFDREVQFQTY